MKNKTKAWIYGIPSLILISVFYYAYFSMIIEGELPVYSLFIIPITLVSFIVMLYYFNKNDDQK